MNFTKLGVTAVIWTAAALLTLLAESAVAVPYAYVRSTAGEPWSRSDNIDAMNSVFGAANVETLLYQTLTTSDLFAPDREMIFMTGSDHNSPALGSFIGANQAAMENWVAAGGSLVITAAENDGGLSNMGFGATWVSSTAGNGFVTDASHPIFAGTGLSNGDLVVGSALHHDSLAGAGFTTLMTAQFGGNPILMERDWGNGYVMLGTLTLNFFTDGSWDQPESQIIHENIFSYAASQSAIPEPSTLLLGAFATAGLLLRRRA